MIEKPASWEYLDVNFSWILIVQIWTTFEIKKHSNTSFDSHLSKTIKQVLLKSALGAPHESVLVRNLPEFCLFTPKLVLIDHGYHMNVAKYSKTLKYVFLFVRSNLCLSRINNASVFVFIMTYQQRTPPSFFRTWTHRTNA